ncbi:MAG: hypothetical protein P4L50_21710 [Anaerolineaceae bacterium]|nr:hypothetical protein [Anaerolineaceae bacterium]
MYTGKTTDMPQFTVTNLQDAVWDPDSRHIYYTAGQDYANKDIWVVDMQTGQTKNLTHSPAIDDANIGFWPYPGLVLFTSRSINENGGPDLAGHLADMKPNGEQPRILSHDFIVEPPVASPDGRTLAILFGQLLQWGGSIQDITFHLINSDYQPKNVVLADPAWSPDGKQIAWSVYVATEDTEYNVLDGVGIYNLANHELRLFNLYVDPGGEGFQRAPVWSPDGQWLALEDNDPSLKNTGLWVARFDGSEEHYLGNFDNPVWSPDSQWLACNDIQVLDMSIGTWVSKVGNWLPYQINLTDNVELVDWNDAAVSSKWKGLPVFTLGNFYVVTDAGNNVTVYDQPAFDSKTVGQLSSDETIKIIAGPIENGEDTWWEMEDDQAGIKGWIIEYWDRYISAN